MICYGQKKNGVIHSTYLPPAHATADEIQQMSPEQREGKTYYKPNEFTYDYTLWDGVSYKLLKGKKFCGRACAADWALVRN